MMCRKIFVLAVALLGVVGAQAYDFVSDGLCYNITSRVPPYTVEVTQKEQWGANYAGLTAANIPATVVYEGNTYSVTRIGWGAFLACSDLKSVTVAASVTHIGESAFWNCDALLSIVVENGNSVYDSRNGCNAIVETATNTLIAGCQQTDVPSDITAIGWGAFWGCRGLESITIPAGVMHIGEGAFWACSGLKSIAVERGNSVYDSRNGCNAIVETATNTIVVGCENTTIAANITAIGERSFYGCSGLSSITIPNSVVSIGDGAFSGCSGLSALTIPASVTHIGELAFGGCSGLKTVTVPASVVRMGASTFADCASLMSVGLPEGIAAIDDGFFWGCSRLGAVTLPSTITRIGLLAFYGCSDLQSITIPANVVRLDDWAFEDCDGLENITIYATTPPAVGTGVFGNYNATLRVPCEAREKYASHEIFGQFSAIEANGDCPPTALETVEMAAIYAKNGRIFCSDDCRIYDLLGRDVTALNGSFSGIYIVKNGEKAIKIVAK